MQQPRWYSHHFSSTSSVLELCMNLHSSAMRQLLSPFYKELSNDCDETCSGNAAESLLCAGQCGLCGAPGVCGVHSWGRGPHYGPESMPILSLPGAEGHLSLRPRSKLPGGWSPGFWSHLCFELALPPGSVTIPPQVYPVVTWETGVRSLIPRSLTTKKGWKLKRGACVWMSGFSLPPGGHQQPSTWGK